MLTLPGKTIRLRMLGRVVQEEFATNMGLSETWVPPNLVLSHPSSCLNCYVGLHPISDTLCIS